MPNHKIKEVLGASYHEGRWQLAAEGRYLDEKEITEEILKACEVLPRGEPGRVVVMPASEFEAYILLRKLIENNAVREYCSGLSKHKPDAPTGCPTRRQGD